MSQHSLNQLEMVSMKTPFISIHLSQCFYLHQRRYSHRREPDIFRMLTLERANIYSMKYAADKYPEANTVETELRNVNLLFCW